MYPFKNPPAPTNRIWAACYMDSVTECFEIRTEAKTPGGIFTLYHKEYPIGTALTEFLYADLKVFPAHLGNIKTCLKEIRAGNDVDTQFLQLFSIALYWLRCSPAFAPLAASIQRQQLYYEQGKRLGTDEIERQMTYYTELQPKLLYLAENFFEASKPGDMTARYFAQRQALGEKGAAEWNNYLPLSYREVSYGPVMKGANGFFPYDDILNEEQRNDIQDFFADTLDAERAEDFTQFILAEYIRRDLRFRVCKFCGRYFGIMGNTRLEFCDRLIDGSTKTCKEMGSLRLYEKRKLEEPAIKEYKRSYKAHRKEIKPMEQAEITKFLQAIQGTKYGLVYQITLFTGLREGEVLGLTWDCIDFQHNAIYINKQLQKTKKVGGTYCLAPTKNSRNRTILTAPSVMALLRKQKSQQAQMRLLAGEAWNNSWDLVFTNELGGHLCHCTVYKKFKAIVRELGMPEERFHDLRHSFAVASIESGDDIKTVQSNLGHATASFTLDVYGHVTQKMRQQSADRMEEFIQKVSG